MIYRKKNSSGRTPPPVPTEKDERGRERQKNGGKNATDAPDGISGSWS